MENILESIKQNLGVSCDDDCFDNSILTYINSTVSILNQIGLPSENTIRVTESTVWSEFGLNDILLSLMKPYVELKVRVLFDPSASNVVTEAREREIAQYEWRLRVQFETKEG